MVSVRTCPPQILWIPFLRCSQASFFVTEHSEFPNYLFFKCQLTLIVVPLIENLPFTFKLAANPSGSAHAYVMFLSFYLISTMYHFFNLVLFYYFQYLWICDYVKGYEIDSVLKGLQASNYLCICTSLMCIRYSCSILTVKNIWVQMICHIKIDQYEPKMLFLLVKFLYVCMWLLVQQKKQFM